MKNLGYLLLIVFTIGCSQSRSNQSNGHNSSKSKYNVLFIAIDDLRPQLGCYGEEKVISPAIDKLAASSAIFTNAYCQMPVCGASRASLLSGLYPTPTKFTTYYTRVDEDTPDVITLPEYFKDQGYLTHSIGKIFHHPNDMESRAWSRTPYRLDWFLQNDSIWNGELWRNYITAENDSLEKYAGGGWPYEIVAGHDTIYNDGKLTVKAVQFLEEMKDTQQPFFLGLGYLKPHLPFNVPEKYWDMYQDQDFDLPVHSQFPQGVDPNFLTEFGELRGYYGIPENGPVPVEMARKLIHGYHASVSYIDAQINIVLETLKKTGQEENTIIVLWGDHGFFLGDLGQWCKHAVFEKAIRVPLLVKVPGLPAKQVNDIVELIDLYPTLCELNNLPLPFHLQGQSLEPVLFQGRDSKGFSLSRYSQNISLRTQNFHFAINETDTMFFDQNINPEESYNQYKNKEDVAAFGYKLDSLLTIHDLK